MSYTIYYHTECKYLTGRAFSPLCILEAGAKTYDIKGPDALPAGSACFAPPMCAFPDGSIIAQTGAICFALGQDCGLAPTDRTAASRALQLNMDAADMLSDVSDKKGAERVMKWVNHFEGALGDKEFFGGDKASYVDYVILAPFENFPLKEKNSCEDFKGVEMTPKVKTWFAKMNEDAAVKKVLAIAPLVPDSYL